MSWFQDNAERLDEMFREWCRLRGHKLPKHGLEAMVDEATGKQEAMHREFAEFFMEVVFRRLPPEVVLGFAASEGMLGDLPRTTYGSIGPPPSTDGGLSSPEADG